VKQYVSNMRYEAEGAGTPGGIVSAPGRADTGAQGEPQVTLDDVLERIGAKTMVGALGDLVECGVMVVDGHRNIVFWSDGAERLLGYRSEEVVGEYCLKANRCVSCMKGCGITEHGEIRNVPLRMYKSDGDHVPVRKTGRAFFDDQGRFIGGIEVLRLDPNLGADLSTAASVGERTRIEQALEEADGHVGKAAQILGISRATLWRKRKRYGL
jgi:PAS domain S-box-containing protein